MVVGVPHSPASGVNVYVVVPGVAVLIVAGFQVPFMLFVEVVGNAGAAEFWQSGPTWVNAGVATALTTIFIVAFVPLSAGVKVYVVVPGVAVLIVAGLQIPVMPFAEVVGRAGGVEFWQRGPICAKDGTTALLISIDIVAVVTHELATVGVKV